MVRQSTCRLLLTTVVLFSLIVPNIPVSSGSSRNGGGTFYAKEAGIPPTIDGTLSPNEWALANSSALSLNGFNSPGTTTSATWYYMNDGTTVYIALSFVLAMNDLVLDFDDGHDHAATVGSEDYVLLDNSFHDRYWDGNTWSEDTGAGGTKDGSGARSADRKVFEVSKPLDTTDTHDMSASAGNTLGFRIEAFTGSEFFRFPKDTVDHDFNANGLGDEMMAWCNLVLSTTTPNAAPTLTNGAVTPSSGNTTTTFEFSVTYTDADDDAPGQAQLLLDGAPHAMTSTDTTYTDGSKFTYSTTLANATHTYNFTFNDGRAIVRFPASGVLTGPAVALLVAPTLTTGSVTPTSGTPSTMFRYKVQYLDLNNDAPLTHQVFIDGTGHDMSTNDTTYIDGSEYTYDTTLPAGQHTFYFSFSDVTGSARFPTSGTINTPSVVIPNRPPRLTNATVSSLTGLRSTNFTFSVDYADPDGDPAAFVNLLIGPKNLTMSSTDTKRFTVTVKLALGAHNFSFVASDGELINRTPAAGDLQGPTVVNAAPVAKIDEGAGPFVIKKGKPFTLNATKSSDEDGDALEFLWTSSLDGELGTDASVSPQLSVGTHNITLRVKDPFGANDTFKAVVTILPLLPHLIVGKPTPSIASPYAGDAIVWTIKVSNDGDASSVAANLSITVDGTAAVKIPLGTIAVNGNKDVTWSWVSAQGSHEVRASIEGQSEGNSTTITVLPNQSPKVVLDGPKTGKVDQLLTFKGTNSTDPEKKALTYAWEFGDGSTATDATVTHAYKKAGTYLVNLTVTDNIGNKDKASLSVVIKAKKKPVGFIPGFDGILAVIAIVSLASVMFGKRRMMLE